ncbi:MAG: Gfo/Idh/MocA family protein, partial [Pirellula sp.]
MTKNKTSPSPTIDRRKLLQTATMLAGVACTPKLVKAYGPNDTLNLAFVGVGGRGGGNLQEMISAGGVRVGAICDVNRNTLDGVGQRHTEAKRFGDFRRLLDDLNGIDAVVVSSTEHTHAFATLPALQQKKPVYCEKPLTYNVQEARRIMVESAKANVPTQMGTQIHAGANYR